MKLYKYLPSNIINDNVANGQGFIRVLLAVRLLVFITVVFINDDGILDLVELDMLETNIRDATLSATPGLDTDTILALGTSTASNSDLLDGFGRATLTEGTNTETVATDTVDVG